MCVPEHQTGLSSQMCAIHYEAPEFLGPDSSVDIIRVHGETQIKIDIVFDSLQELICQLNGDIGTRYAFGIIFYYRKLIHIRMFYVSRQHQSTPPSLLSDFTCGIGETLHEGRGTGGRLGGVIDLVTCRT